MSETSEKRGGPTVPQPNDAPAASGLGLGAGTAAPPAHARGLDEEDPRVRAERRAEEFMGRMPNTDRGVDKFYIDLRIIPPGWDYEWKTLTVWGKENPAYQVQLAQSAWEPVPRHRHPEMMPPNYPGNTIEREGQILMERPMKLTLFVRSQDNLRARQQVHAKEEQLGHAPEGHFDRSSDKRVRPNINKTYEHIPIPET